MYLLTFGVIAFQLVILVTILAAASAGRSALFKTSGFWVAVTACGAIATAGLLLLQLITIGVSFLIGAAMITSPVAASRLAPVAAPPPVQPSTNATDWAGVLGVGVLLVAIVWGSLAKRNAPIESNAPPIATTAAASPPEPEISAKVVQPSRPALTVPRGDLRACLALRSNEAIARCAEAAH